jgi:hypothetical protein
MTLGSSLSSAASRFPEKPGDVIGDGKLDYAEKAVHAMASGILIVLLLTFGARVDVVRVHESLAQGVFQPAQNERLLRSRNIAPTGQTLPRPGASQIGEESAQEKAAQTRSQGATRTICSNCD